MGLVIIMTKKYKNNTRLNEFYIDAIARINQLIVGIMILGTIIQEKIRLDIFITGMLLYLIFFIAGIYLCKRSSQYDT
ncbi:MAG: hypothetical protein KKA19_06820 [Candidatus Margulisbacteria bacterium]|nr:hypothetical protein [Candidatus Margulisiibacteriota bacterium]